MSQKTGTYAHYMDVDPARFSFVGSMYDFESDMLRCAQFLGVGEYRPRKINSAPEKTAVPDDLRDAYRRANPKEIAVYESMLARRAAIMLDPGW